MNSVFPDTNAAISASAMFFFYLFFFNDETHFGTEHDIFNVQECGEPFFIPLKVRMHQREHCV